MRKFNLLSIGLLLLLGLVGCKYNAFESYNSSIYNGSIEGSFVDGGNYIYGTVSNNLNNFTAIMKNKATGKVESFIRDPFYNDKKDVTYVKQIYIDNNKGYYLDSSGTDNEVGFTIIEFNLNTFNKKDIYIEKKALSKKVFLGLNEISDVKVSKENDFSQNKTDNLSSLDSSRKFFVYNEYIYIIRQNGIFRINIKTKKQIQLINENDLKSISSDGEYIYYINDTYDLYKYSIKTASKVKLTSNKSSYSIITKSKIIYTNLNDLNRIYVMNKDGSDNHKINDSKSKNMNYDDTYIYYSNDDDNQCLYRIKYDGSCNKKMTDRPAYFIFTFKDYNKVYIWSNDIKSGSIKNFSVDKKDFHIQLLDF